MFRFSLAYHHGVRSCIKESLDFIIITTVNTHLQAAPITFYTSVSINHPLMNFRQFHILELIIMSNDCFIQLYTP